MSKNPKYLFEKSFYFQDQSVSTSTHVPLHPVITVVCAETRLTQRTCAPVERDSQGYFVRSLIPARGTLAGNIYLKAIYRSDADPEICSRVHFIRNILITLGLKCLV